METIISIASQIGSIGAFIVLGYLLFERLVDKGYLRIGKWVNGNGKEQKTSRQEHDTDTRAALAPLYSQMETLSEHFNHDTTDALKDIANAQYSVSKKLDVVISKQEEMLKYGVPMRK